jgi:copper homeostasis protein
MQRCSSCEAATDRTRKWLNRTVSRLLKFVLTRSNLPWPPRPAERIVSSFATTSWRAAQRRVQGIATAREKLGIKLHVIIRPRGGDFCYSDVEFDVMNRDIKIAKQLGVDGVVIGILFPDGSIDMRRTQELIDLARPMSVTFHRAFDMTRDAFEAMETLISIGIDRILTSGQEPSVIEGLEMISRLAKQAGDRISIMACGGVNERNIKRVVIESGVSELHVTGFVGRASEMQYRNERVFMGGTLRPPEYSISVTDAEKIAALKKAL